MNTDMRSIIRILIAIFLLLVAGPVVAQAGVQEKIEQVCREYILSQTQWEPDDVEIEFRRFIRPKINWTGVALRVNHPRNADLCGMVTLKVTVVKGGQELRRFPVPVDITLFDDVVVTTRRLKRKDVITDGDVVIERRDINLRKDRPFTALKEVVGWRVRRSLADGAVLTQTAIEENPLVLRGEKVTLRYQTANLLLTAIGEAIEDGWKGRPIRVKNLSSKKLITGVPVDDGIVDVLCPN